MPERTLERRIDDILNGDAKGNALDFISFLQANAFQTQAEHGAVTYQDEAVCYIHLDGSEQAPGPWTVWLMSDYSAPHQAQVPLDDQLKAIGWAHVNSCGNCGGHCSPGRHKKVFGKEFDNVCSTDLAFCNPDSITLQYIKKLIEMRKFEMDKYTAAMTIMSERFGKDSLIAIATTDGDRLYNRMVDAYYEKGAFYVSTNTDSSKIKQINANPEIAVCAVDWFSGHGVGKNLGWVLLPENAAIRAKLRAAFDWYDAANNEQDKNCCILEIRLTDGMLIKDYHAIRYQIDFINQSALLSENWEAFK